MDKIISNVVFHHASVVDEEGHPTGEVGEFDYILVNVMVPFGTPGGNVIQYSEVVELWDNLTMEEKAFIAKAYQAIQRVVNL